MIVRTNTINFDKQMNNIIDYAIGFLDGAQKGKSIFLKNLGAATIESMARYVDVSARGNPAALQHVYEWYQTGSPSARLFDINYTVSNLGLSINSTFKQSRTVKKDSNVPFYNKAKIMEEGVSVVIKPRNAKVLAFTENGEDIFTANPVVVNNPGGDQVQGAYQRTFDSFFQNYFSQSFLRASGLFEYLSNPKAFKTNLKQGSFGGRRVGYNTGYSWIVNATIEVE